MDPRSHPSRPPSTSMSQGSAPLSSMPMPPQYSMQYSVSQAHTLPPLQPHHTPSPAPHPYMTQSYRPDMSRFPTTSAHDVYATSTAPMAPHTPVNSLPPSSFLTHGQHQAQQQQQQQFQSPHTLLPPASSAQSYPQPIAPAPPRDRRPDFASMPSGAFSHPEGKGPMWATTESMVAPNGMAAYPNKEPPRTQVVGSQGRRGILPSVPGRPAATNGTNGTAKSTTIPAKDADGKFPCPHCNKTYLHAKHLKRHLLRHTGDRPYMCVLCKDTFSRSDILKRHFQKCSLRRGNPTGASHLSHPHAHIRKSQAAANAAKPIQDEAKPPMMQDPNKRPIMQGQQPPHTSEIDWTTMFPPGTSDGYMNPVFPQSMAQPHDPIHAHVDADRKYYPATTAGHPDGGLNGLYLASTTLGGDGSVQPARQ